MKKYFEIIIVVLLCISIALNIMVLVSKEKATSFAFNVEELLEQDKEWNEYTKSIGDKYLMVIDDKVSTSEYNYKSIIGSVKNNSNYMIEDVYINVILYKNNQIVHYTNEYIYKIPANATLDFEVYVSDIDFDSYVIDYVSGVIPK